MMTPDQLSTLEKAFNERGFILAAEVFDSGFRAHGESFRLAADILVIGNPPSTTTLECREVRVQDLGIRIEFFALVGKQVEPSVVVRAWQTHLLRSSGNVRAALENVWADGEQWGGQVERIESEGGFVMQASHERRIKRAVDRGVQTLCERPDARGPG